MEYVEGPTLKEYIQENGPLPPEDAVHIASRSAMRWRMPTTTRSFIGISSPTIFFGKKRKGQGDRLWHRTSGHIFHYHPDRIGDGRFTISRRNRPEAE